MRFWKTAAARALTAAAQRHDNEQRIAAERRARLDSNKAAFYATVARMGHDAAAPAVGKSAPSDRRMRF